MVVELSTLTKPDDANGSVLSLQVTLHMLARTLRGARRTTTRIGETSLDMDIEDPFTVPFVRLSELCRRGYSKSNKHSSLLTAIPYLQTQAVFY